MWQSFMAATFFLRRGKYAMLAWWYLTTADKKITVVDNWKEKCKNKGYE